MKRAALILFVLLLVSSAQAQTNWFSTNTAVNAGWSDPTGWTNNLGATGVTPALGGSSDYSIVMQAGAINKTNDLGTAANSGFQLNQLLFTVSANVYGSNLVFLTSSTGVAPQIQKNGGDVTIGAGLVLSNNLSLAGTSSSGTLTLNGPITGAGGLALNSSYNVNLSVSNSYAGGTTINTGVISVGNNSAFGSGDVTLAGGTLKPDTVADRTIANNIVVSANSTNTIDTPSKNLTLNGNLSGSGVIVRGTTGLASVLLGGDNSAYSGMYTSPANNNAVIRFTSATAGSAAATWYFNNTFATRQTLDFNNGTIHFGSFNGTGQINNNNGSAGQTNTIVIGEKDGANDIYAGAIVDGTAQSLAIIKMGTGTQTFSGANTYSGRTIISNGTLVAGANFILNNSPLTVASGATFTNNFQQAVRSIAGAGNIILGASGVLSNGFDNTSTTFSGIISGAGQLAKYGTGSLTLSGTNIYSGGTTLNGGTITVGNAQALGTGALTMSGGTLNSSGGEYLLSNNIIVAAGTSSAFQINNPNNLTLYGNLSGSGSLAMGNGGNNNSLFLTGTNNMTGGFIIFANNVNAVRIGSAAWGSTNVAFVFNNTTANKDTLDYGTGTICFGSMTGAGTLRGNSAGLHTIVAGALGSNDTFSGTLVDQSGQIALTKVGTGTMILSGANSYSGATLVNAGTLAVNGSLAAGSAVTVNSGGTLGGTGIVNGAVTVANGGALSPGLSPGKFTVGSLTLASNSTFFVELGGTSAGNFDQVVVNGNMSLSNSTLNVALLYTPTAGDSFLILTNSGNTFGTFAGLAEGAQFSAGSTTLQISYQAGDGNDVLLTVVPEPGPLTLVAAGIAFLLVLRERRSSNSGGAAGGRV